MPKPKDGEAKEDFIGRCVIEVMKEGDDQKQALGKCYGIWNANKGMEQLAINKAWLKDQIRKARYDHEYQDLMALRGDDSEPMSDKGIEMLHDVYSRARHDGVKIDDASRIAWDEVKRAGLTGKKNDAFMALHNRLTKLVESMNGRY